MTTELSLTPELRRTTKLRVKDLRLNCYVHDLAYGILSIDPYFAISKPPKLRKIRVDRKIRGAKYGSMHCICRITSTDES